MRLSTRKLDRIYQDYGFSVREAGATTRAYIYDRGPYQNVDLVPVGDDDSGLDAAKRSLEVSGYSVTIRRLKSESEAETLLFQRFFRLSASREALARRLAEFETIQSRTMGVPYEYIPAPYKVTVGTQRVSENVVDAVVRLCEQKIPTLVLVEAAAGYGKTCTAIRVLQTLLQRDQGILPLFTELQRNRTARIFRYVLLDEIDNSIGLPSSIVQSRVLDGRMPLIIDGFDELLSRDPVGGKQTFEEAEPMLDTIGAMLRQNATILITTRRTAVFEDAAFDRWVAGLGEECSFHRIRLDAPRIDDWLPPSRRADVENVGFPVTNFSNPVLLTYLRQLSAADFREILRNPERVVERYMNSLLAREQERQTLRMVPAEQLKVLRSIARAMLAADITHDTRANLRSVLLSDTSVVQSLETCRQKYHGKEALSIDELVDKFLVHALLDRLPGQAYIGFINDTILGTLQGDVLLEDKPAEWVGSEGQVDRIVTAYSLQGSDNRQSLLRLLGLVRGIADAPLRLMIDIRLQSEPSSECSNATYDGMTFDGVTFGATSQLTEVTFVNCVFQGCNFALSGLQAIGFQNCKFFSCRSTGAPKVGEAIWCQHCASEPEGFVEALTATKVARRVRAPAQNKGYGSDATIKSVLEQFWPPGRAGFQKRLNGRTLFRGRSNAEHRNVSTAIEELRESGLIVSKGDYYELVVERVSEIAAIVGRSDGATRDRS